MKYKKTRTNAPVKPFSRQSLHRIHKAKKNGRIFSGTAYQVKKLLTVLCKKSFFLLFPPKMFSVIFPAPIRKHILLAKSAACCLPLLHQEYSILPIIIQDEHMLNNKK
ncbi:hypothetical protein [Dialister invisus]|uniref:hypothetical protein n=1 Tax=Dialister invisus TaxID=218538 RepID=UPI00288C5416|nr:hypothetical protein [Dialister invisus]